MDATAPRPTRIQVQTPASSRAAATHTEARAKSPARSLNSSNALIVPARRIGEPDLDDQLRGLESRGHRSPEEVRRRQLAPARRATGRRSWRRTCTPGAAAPRSGPRGRSNRRPCRACGSADGRSGAARRQMPPVRGQAGGRASPARRCRVVPPDREPGFGRGGRSASSRSSLTSTRCEGAASLKAISGNQALPAGERLGVPSVLAQQRRVHGRATRLE